MFKSYEDKYIVSRWMYSIGEEIISDSEYNNLHRYMIDHNLLQEYTSRSWSSDHCPIDLLKQYGLESKAHNITLSEKTDSIESITSEADLYMGYSDLNSVNSLSLKIDGINFQLTYHNKKLIHKQTRGRSKDALVFDDLNIFPEEITEMGKIRIVGELALSEEAFVTLKEMYPEKDLVSRRSSVRTAMANKNAHHLLTFIAFDIHKEEGEYDAVYLLYKLQEWGFEVPYYVICKDYGTLLEGLRTLDNYKKTYPYLTDGVVIRSAKGRLTKAIRLFSWSEQIYKSYVTHYVEDWAAHTISIKLGIYPIRLENSTQRQIPITNLKRIVSNNLQIGMPVAFKFVSSSIADIDEGVTKLLQDQYLNNLELYRAMIESEEYHKRTTQRHI